MWEETIHKTPCIDFRERGEGFLCENRIHWHKRSRGYEFGFIMIYTFLCLVIQAFLDLLQDRTQFLLKSAPLRQLYHPEIYPVLADHKGL